MTFNFYVQDLIGAPDTAAQSMQQESMMAMALHMSETQVTLIVLNYHACIHVWVSLSVHFVSNVQFNLLSGVSK